MKRSIFQSKRFNKKSKLSGNDSIYDDSKRILKLKSETTKNFIHEGLLKKQTSLNINGIPLYFPFTPYDLQVTYMRHVIEALQKSQNALL
jgi:hypothetical protein